MQTDARREPEDAPAVESVVLDVLEREPRADLLRRALDALRAERLVGVLVRDDEMQALGALTGELAVDGSTALVAGHDGPEGGLSLEVVAARISRALDAAVVLDPMVLDPTPHPALPDGPGPIAEPVRVVPVGFDPDAALAERMEAASGAATRVVSLLPLAASAVAPRLPELAQAAGGRAVLVPAGERSLVVTESPELPTWWAAAKPVLAVVARDDRTDLLAWTRKPLEPGAGRMQRWAGEADWGVGWNDPPLGVQPDGAPTSVLELQQALRAVADAALPAALAERLGWDEAWVAELEALWREPHGAVPVERIVAAIGGPAAMARLALGGDAALEPGATAYEPRGMRATLADAMILASRPKGDSRWSRYERWWWRRPTLSTGVGVALLALAAVIATAATIGDAWSWWRAALCAAVAINGAGLLGSAALARREQRQRQG